MADIHQVFRTSRRAWRVKTLALTPDAEFNLQNPCVGDRREPLYDSVFSLPRTSRGTGPSHTRIVA